MLVVVNIITTLKHVHKYKLLNLWFRC